MLDINFIRENPQVVKETCKKKSVDVNVDLILDLDKKKREMMTEMEALKAEQNKISRGGKDNLVLIAQAKEIKERFRSMEPELEKIEAEFNDLMASLPNIVADDVVIAAANDDKVILGLERIVRVN